ncbi:MAG TPA: alpha/beta hydrolase [Bradyrhizobium sp.]|nr:alpha/beta hydrolase [Bradyrhizobium sp.]
MVGANPKFQTSDHVSQVTPPGATRHALTLDAQHGAGSHRLRWIALLSAIVPLSLVLVQCGKAPDAEMLAANSQTSGDTFDDRFPAPQFNDRFSGASEPLVPRQSSDAPRKRMAQADPAPYRVASLAPTVPYQRPAREEQTTLVGLKSSAFPYLGNNPRTDEPFLNVSSGDRRGHRGLGGKVFWQDETYNDNRVLMHVPENFDVRKPGVIVVFFHGNGATLERDVRDRQLVPQQISDAGVNAVLLAPQLAVDAADSSAGKFWQRGGLKRFVTESSEHLARLYGDPGTAKAFANMPVVIVGYSGGFVPAAWSLEVGGLGNRVRGVFLLDAVYGELDKFASWIVNNRSGFFVSAYTHYTKRHDNELMQMLKEKGIAIAEDMDGPLRPGSVVFVETPEGVTHRDYVTHAWTENPVKEVLVKMAATPALTRMAAGTLSSASR